MTESLDSKPYVEYDPVIGYRYIAGTKCTLPRPGGGRYEIVINSDGIRSTREYAKQKPAGVFRALVLGDSFAAGQFVSNDQRFTEILERKIAKSEVVNFALEGTGTDQQLLIYEHLACRYEHDVVILLPFLQNIRRNLVDARAAFDPKTGRKVLRGKPRFELCDGRLVLKNTPVPEDPTAMATVLTEQVSDERTGIREQIKTGISRLPAAGLLKSLVYSLVPWEPFPEYRQSNSEGWRLMAAILQRLQQRAAPRPLVILPVVYDSYVRFRMARNYWDRFRSLASHNVHVIDLLPHLQRLGRDSVRCFQVPHDCHFSSYGHLVLADVLMAELKQRQLVP